MVAVAEVSDIEVVVDAQGIPHFTVPPGFVWTAATAFHEIGHVYQRTLRRRSPTTDYYALYWAFRGFRGTWQDAKTYAESVGGPGWAGLPDESWAECLGASIAGSWIRHEKTLDDGKPVDALAARAFFQSLTPQEAVLNIVDLPSDFFSSRNGQPIRYIVLHTTQGTDSRTWLTKTGNVSAHYLVRGSTVYRLVGEQFAAWHAGLVVGTPTTPYFTGEIVGYDDYDNAVWSVNPNYESIGIEMEGFAAVPLDQATLQATADLIRDIRTRHPKPLVDHRELSPGNRTDPGVNRALVDALLGEESPVTDAEFLEKLHRLYTPALQTELDANYATKDHAHQSQPKHNHSATTTVATNA